MKNIKRLWAVVLCGVVLVTVIGRPVEAYGKQAIYRVEFVGIDVSTGEQIGYCILPYGEGDIIAGPSYNIGPSHFGWFVEEQYQKTYDFVSSDPSLPVTVTSDITITEYYKATYYDVSGVGGEYDSLEELYAAREAAQNPTQSEETTVVPEEPTQVETPAPVTTEEPTQPEVTTAEPTEELTQAEATTPEQTQERPTQAEVTAPTPTETAQVETTVPAPKEEPTQAETTVPVPQEEPTQVEVTAPTPTETAKAETTAPAPKEEPTQAKTTAPAPQEEPTQSEAPTPTEASTQSEMTTQPEPSTPVLTEEPTQPKTTAPASEEVPTQSEVTTQPEKIPVSAEVASRHGMAVIIVLSSILICAGAASGFIFFKKHKK